MKKKIAIIGAGSAGIQSACHFLAYLNKDWQITLIHDPKINILGIGESSNPPFINALEVGTNFNMYNDLDALDGTMKLGTVYKNWREHDFFNPLLTGQTAVHFNTHKLKEFAIPRLHKKWPDKFVEIHGTCTEIVDDGTKVTLLIDKEYQDFDYLVDCRGFPRTFNDLPGMPKGYNDYTVVENPTVNYSLTYNKPRIIEDIVTGHVATPDGWMFTVPLTSRTGCGYMFNTSFTTIDQARQNFSKIIDVPVDEITTGVEYKFQSYYTNKLLNGRILKNGNQSVFFEPMFANSLWVYDQVNRLFFDHLINGASEEATNQKFKHVATSVLDLIYFHYHGGSNFKTPFWEYIVPLATKKVYESPHFKHACDVLKYVKESRHYVEGVQWVYSALNLEVIDKNFGYNYFT